MSSHGGGNSICTFIVWSACVYWLAAARTSIELKQIGFVMVSEPRKILREAEAGMQDKGDVVVRLTPGPEGSGVSLDLESKVMALFGEQIKASVLEEISAYNLTDVQVTIRDNGALDYAIRARAEAAIERAIREDV